MVSQDRDQLPSNLPTSDYTAAAAAASGATDGPALPSLQGKPRRPLSIDEIVLPEEAVQVYGTTYYMRSTEHLGSSEQQKVFLYWGRITDIETRIRDDIEASGPKDDEDLRSAYDQLFKILIPRLPRAIFHKLRPAQRKRLFAHFLDFQDYIYELLREEVTTSPSNDSHSTGDTISPGSLASIPE